MKNSPPSQHIRKLAILIPVFNDWASASQLLQDIDVRAQDSGLEIDCVIINDASVLADEGLLAGVFRNLSAIRVIDLKRNVGHQKAIAIGLSVLSEENRHDAVIVMDGDGEDDPKYMTALVAKCEQEQRKKIIFAQRQKRSEGLGFRLFYAAYQWLFWLATGEKFAYGNYSIIPAGILPRVATLSEIWNHYAAGILKSRTPFSSIPAARHKRHSGKSQMKFVDLLNHGIQAISVYADKAGGRLLTALSLLILIFLILLLVVIGIRLLTTWAVPGWATYTVGFLTLGILQALLLSVIFLFMSLFFHNAQFFSASCDIRMFIAGQRIIFTKK
jgi:hypothetical protein